LVLLLLLLLNVVRVVERNGFPSSAVLPLELRVILRFTLAIIAVINVIQPYQPPFLGTQFRISQRRLSMLLGGPGPSTFLLGLILATTPVMCTVFLFALGDPARDVAFGAVVTLVAVVVWCFHPFARSRQEDRGEPRKDADRPAVRYPGE
jgi:hypothetical protein